MLPLRVICLSLLIALIILLPTPVGACTMPRQPIYIRCADSTTLLLPVTRIWSPTANVESEMQAVSAELDKLIPNCGAANIASLKTTFEPYYRRWLQGEFVVFPNIEAYSLQYETELIEQRDQLTNCRYQAFTKVGNWLFISNQRRDYCDPGYCFSMFISPSKFLGYVITNPSWRTLPYLVGFAIAAAAIVMGWMAFLRQRISRLRKLTQLLLIWIVLVAIGFFTILVDGSFTLGLEIVTWSLVALIIAVFITLRQRSKVTAEVQPDST